MSKSPAKLSMPARIVMRSTTGISLDDRFTKLAKGRPPESLHSAGSGSTDPSLLVNDHHVMCPCGQRIRDEPQYDHSTSQQQTPPSPTFDDRLRRKRVLDRLGRRSKLREQGQRLRTLLGDRIRSLNDTPRARVIVGRSRSRARPLSRHGNLDARIALDYMQHAPYWRDHVDTSQLWPRPRGYWNPDRDDRYDRMPAYRPRNAVIVKRLRMPANGKRNRTKFSLDRELSTYMNEGRKAKNLLDRQLGLQPT